MIDSAPHADVGLAASLLDCMSDMAVAVNAQLRVVAVNEAFRRELAVVCGVHVRLGERIDEIMTRLSVDPGKVAAFCKRALTGESCTVVEESSDLRRERKTYALTFSPLRSGGNEIGGVAFILRDVSSQHTNSPRADLERRVAERTAELERTNRELSQRVMALRVVEAALVESSLDFRATFDQAAVGIAHVTIDGRWMRMNDRLCLMCGYSRGELMSMNFWELLHREAGIRDENMTDCLLSGNGSSYAVEKRCRHRDGKVFWANLTVSLVRDHAGLPKYFIFVVEDISRRKQAEAELQESRRNLELAVEAADLGMFDYRPQTGANFWSDRLRQHFGLDGDEDVDYGRFMEGIHPDDRERVHEALQQALEPGKGMYEVEYRTIGLHDGKERWIAARGKAYFDEAGRAERLIGVTHDVTARHRAEEELRYQLELNLSITANAGAAIIVTDRNGDIVTLNRETENMFGYSAPEARGRNMHELIHHRHADGTVYPGVECRLMRAISAGAVERIDEETMYRKNGELLFVSCVSSPLIHNGDRIGAVTILSDISERKRMEQALRTNEARFRLAFDNIPDVVVIYDRDLRIQYINPATTQITGMPVPAFIGKREDEIWPVELTSRWRPTLLSAFENAKVETVDIAFPGEDGERNLRVTCVPLAGDDGSVREVMGVTHDYTERKRAEERARQAALHDPLTGLPNRALLFEYAPHLLAHTQRTQCNAAVMFIDLDRFKPINDTCGHEAGDAVLREVAQRLRANIRKEDMAFRLGGDEFLVFLPNVPNDDGAAEVARHIVDDINRPYHYGGHELALSSSIGISIYPRDSADIDGLIQCADAAMYQAKQNGRNHFQFYSQKIAERAHQQTAIESKVKKALFEDEFRLHYQPVVDIANGKVIGVEALLRWPHDDIGPERFVPVAESAGLIDSLGEWVLSEVCRQHHAWQSGGLPVIPIAVNVSAVQFRHKHFAERFGAAMRDMNVSPEVLQLELTETALMENFEHAIGALVRFKELGIKIALDDFGTGYSSLSYLSRLPIDKIKVDKSFVNRIDTDMASRAVTEAIIALGRTLNLEIVAEGIESAHAMDYLRSHGCHHAQGFHVCEPVAADDFTAWYRTWHGNA